MRSAEDTTSKAEREEWIFTFGSGQQHQGCFVRIPGTWGEAREKMFKKYGREWAFQYSTEEWEDWERRRPIWVPAEIEIPFEEEEV